MHTHTVAVLSGHLSAAKGQKSSWSMLQLQWAAACCALQVVLALLAPGKLLTSHHCHCHGYDHVLMCIIPGGLLGQQLINQVIHTRL